ncbi:MAG: copper resistance protein CopC [Chloroflexi bacterium]|nr:copper resistance protein CopC [Chloroflexota bacterium]
MKAMTTITAITTNTSNRLLIAVLVGAAAMALAAPEASAHAAYESSSPGFAEVLSESPDVISIRFTQELFRREGANEISLRHVDSGEAIDLSDARIGNDDRKLMTADVRRRLAPGRYLVSWTNLSAEDGDEDSGSYPFYVTRDPTAAEQGDDRQIAGDLLVTYPGDEPEEPEETATLDAEPVVVRSAESDDVSLGAGPMIWLAVGVSAGVVLVGALGYRLGQRRRVD